MAETEMYEALVARLRTICPEDYGNPMDFAYGVQQAMCEAANAIEELAKDLERSKEYEAFWNKEAEEALRRFQVAVANKPRWIPVTEQLPLYGQDVLAVRTYGDGEKCQEVLMAHIAVWNEETGEKWWNATNITNWMPLPEPPKEET